MPARLRLSAALLVLFLAPACFAGEAASEAEQRLKADVTYLASDELEGRGPGTAGLDKAADFIAGEFKKLGLKTQIYDGGPFQKFQITVSTELGPKDQNRLTLVYPPAKGETPTEHALKLDEDFTPLAMGGSEKIEGGLVFVGYGITAKGLLPPGTKAEDKSAGVDYDDYAGLDVEGKIVVILRKEPQQENKESVFDGVNPSQHALFTRKFSNAFEHGAAGVIIVNDRLELQTREKAERYSLTEAIKSLGEAQAKLAETKELDTPEAKKLLEDIAKYAQTVATQVKSLSGSQDSLMPFNGGGDESTRNKMPIFFCKREAVEPLIKSALGKDLATIETEIDETLKPQSAELAGCSARGEANIVRKQAEVKNVLAVLEGEGPLADETIVVGAHYDHLGHGGPGSLAPWTKEIHNGADDNASGTATLLEIARQLAAGPKPRHRVVFMAFTGEERGLLGSAKYVRDPRFALEKTIAMFNLDMVGRLTDDKLIVYGTGTAEEFDPLVTRLCEEQHFKLTKQPGGFGPSDHSSFYAKKIPVLHFFTGNHADYHRPSDDADKLNIAGMRRVAELVVDIVRATDASQTRPKYLEVKRMESIALGPERKLPWFGSIPDYAAEVEGLAISGVQPESPAQKAGLKGGDVVVKVGASKIANIEDFMSALMKHKPGETVKVVVLRGKEQVETEVTLSSRPKAP
jgi:hypothetical protein